VYSARYGSPDGGKTELPSSDRNALLLGELSDESDRNAYFVCCMVALHSVSRYVVAQETLIGQIATQPSGAGGFGYDPIFLLPERGVTVAEIPDAEKNRISHRGKAALRIAALLGGQLDRGDGAP
jgi:XTP/dITP diphosphohydrolase